MSSIASTTASPTGDADFFGHPRGLSTLFFAELWERFSYYGMRAILILFMTAAVTQGGLGFATDKAGLIYGTYTSMVYLMALPGGWLADKFLGLRRAVLVGGVIIMCGHIALAIPSLATFYLGLVLVVIGTGFLKPNISALVGALYSPDDARRDAGFSIYYMGINLGAFLAPLAVGWLAQGEGFRNFLSGMGISPAASWHFGFAAAAVGMFCGLVWYVSGSKHLGQAGLKPSEAANSRAAARNRRILFAGVGGMVGTVALLAVLGGTGLIVLTPENVSRTFGYILAFTPVVLFPSLYFFGGFEGREKKQILVIMALFFGAAVFWSVFEQAGSTLNLFAERDTENRITGSLAGILSLILLVPAVLSIRWVLSLERKRPLAVGFAVLVSGSAVAGILFLFLNIGNVFPSSFFQSANALFIVVLAPLFATMWTTMGKRQPSSPVKFAIGLLFAGLGFALLILAAKAAAGGAKVSPLWLTAVYMLHTFGELALSPVGLSAMTSLAPQRIVGFALGIWFLAASLGNFMAGIASSFYERMPLPTLFTTVTLVALVAAVLMAFVAGPIRRMLARN